MQPRTVPSNRTALPTTARTTSAAAARSGVVAPPSARTAAAGGTNGAFTARTTTTNSLSSGAVGSSSAAAAAVSNALSSFRTATAAAAAAAATGGGGGGGGAAATIESNRVASASSSASSSAQATPVPPPETAAAAAAAAANQPRKIYSHPLNPTRLSTVKLLRTFKRINELFFARRKLMKLYTSDVGVDTSTDYEVSQGEVLLDRYEVVGKEPLGRGTYGIVVKCYDLSTCSYVAIKISRNNEYYQAQAHVEKWLLEKFMDLEGDKHSLVKFTDAFLLNDRQCLVFELLDMCMFELLKLRNFQGLSLLQLQHVLRRSLVALAFLARPDIDVIHADIKPENLLLPTDHDVRSIKLIDFGSSCRANENMQIYLQSRFYRAPEVLLGLPYAQPIDMWSLGCTICELFTGRPLFAGRDELDQMIKIIEVIGLPPPQMIKTAFSRQKQRASSSMPSDPFHSSARCLELFEQTADGYRPAVQMRVKLNPLESSTLRAAAMQGYASHASHRNAVMLFTDLLSKMVKFDPEERGTPEEMLAHPFLSLKL